MKRAICFVFGGVVGFEVVPTLWSGCYRQLGVSKEGFTEASLGLLANQRKRQLLTGLLKSLRTIKTLVRFGCWCYNVLVV